MTTSDLTIPESPANLGRQLPHASESGPFVSAFAGGWSMHEDGVPRVSLRRYMLSPGQHGIGESMRGDLKKQIHHLQGSTDEHKQALLPLNETAPGYGGYVKRFDSWDPASRSQVTSYRLAWDVPKIGTDRRSNDVACFDAFIARWQELGLVPTEVDSYFVDKRIALLDRRLVRERQKNPVLAGRRARLVAWELEAWEAYRAGAEPLPLAGWMPAAAPAPVAPAAAVKPAAPKPAPAAPAAPKASKASPKAPAAAKPAPAPKAPVEDLTLPDENEEDESGPSMSAE